MAAARPGRPAGKKGSSVGSGGNNKRRLAGKGPTPPGEARKNHPKAKAAAAARKAAATRAARPAAAPTKLAFNPAAQDGPETVVGRNPVVEALRAKVPGTTLYVALGIDVDDRVREAGMLAQRADIPIVEVERRELDRITSSGMHQGIALVVPPYAYLHPDELLTRAQESGEPPLLVALDGVTDPRNLGAAIRSAAAFGAHGALVPERRSAGVTASAWRTSAGAVARLPVAQATNLTRALDGWKQAGVFTVGLAADGEVDLDDLQLALDPLCIVVGSEGKGLSRLVSQSCDVRVSIPMVAKVESLNASVAVSVVLAEVARRRRAG